ncbi:hypothetical protein [Actinomadura macrotermitis]|uniref:Integral membrane protein n=1 Tax=Actinomadura macrotermitis TaxID=2585200 RepID=A0A7K0BUB6_9ACTN|nr:hypothetical protein [Actinomadura macrotermitis]MQY04769.1 hypothetical protein [Actinomadura macrotermitis]
MNAVILACCAQLLFFAAYVMFKSAAARMRPLTGRRPLIAVGSILHERRWLLGLVVLMAGFAMADLALLTLPIASALPAYSGTLPLLLMLGIWRFGDRLTRREAAALLLTVAAMVLAALSVLLVPEGPLTVTGRPADPAVPPLWKMAAVVVPSLLIPVWMFAARDRLVPARHARRLTGVAYGIGAGAMLGTSEVFGLGLALRIRGGHARELLTGPLPPLFLVSGLLGIGLLSIGLQRCRLTVLVTVLTVTAKIHLLLSATLLYGEPWPRDPVVFGLRAGAVLVAVLAVLVFPRYERKTRKPKPPASAAPDAAYVGRRRRNAVSSV